MFFINLLGVYCRNRKTGQGRLDINFDSFIEDLFVEGYENIWTTRLITSFAIRGISSEYLMIMIGSVMLACVGAD